MKSDWQDRLFSGDRMTLARAISQVENNGPQAKAVLRAVFGRTGHAQVLGFTGSPGVGKSTLVSGFIGEVRAQGKTVGVIAVDPSSPFSGGAVLGDRVRMGEHGGDEGVFIRSLASRGHVGGLSRTAARVADVMDAAGLDVVLLETVGSGQSEVEVHKIAQTRVVVVAPGMGDDIQAVKAGILEIADVMVVNKGDLAMADTTKRQLEEALSLGKVKNDWVVPVLLTVATQGKGLKELAEKVFLHQKTCAEPPALASRKRLWYLVAQAAAEKVSKHLNNLEEGPFHNTLEQVLKGEADFDDVVDQVLAEIYKTP